MIRFEYDKTYTTAWTVEQILLSAAQEGKAAPVAHHLLGARLAVRFPQLRVPNPPYGVARPSLNDTTFVIALEPTTADYDACAALVDAGREVYLLVPLERDAEAQQALDARRRGRVSIDSVEDCIGMSLDLMGCEAPDGHAGVFRRFLETYNARVDAVETDKSLLIELPHNLVG